MSSAEAVGFSYPNHFYVSCCPLNFGDFVFDVLVATWASARDLPLMKRAELSRGFANVKGWFLDGHL